MSALQSLILSFRTLLSAITLPTPRCLTRYTSPHAPLPKQLRNYHSPTETWLLRLSLPQRHFTCSLVRNRRKSRCGWDNQQSRRGCGCCAPSPTKCMPWGAYSSCRASQPRTTARSPWTVVFLGRESLSLKSPMLMRNSMFSRVRVLLRACIQRLFQLYRTRKTTPQSTKPIASYMAVDNQICPLAGRLASQRWLNKIMITTTTPEPDRNFWEELTTKVAEIGQRTRDHPNTARIPGQRSLRKRHLTRFELEEAWHRAQEEERKIANRLKYIEVESQRHQRTLELARRKYERMMEVRNRSIRERDDCRQKITSVEKETAQQVAAQAQRIREERGRTANSLQRVKQQHDTEAESVRLLRAQNEEAVRRCQEAEVEQKRELVEKAHQSMEQSRLRLSKMQEERVQMGKEEHKEYLKRQVEVNLSQSKRNSLLRQKLQLSLAEAGQDKEQRLAKLQHYRQSLAATPRTIKNDSCATIT